jgi:hypothetical protein
MGDSGRLVRKALVVACVAVVAAAAGGGRSWAQVAVKCGDVASSPTFNVQEYALVLDRKSWHAERGGVSVKIILFVRAATSGTTYRVVAEPAPAERGGGRSYYVVQCGGQPPRVSFVIPANLIPQQLPQNQQASALANLVDQLDELSGAGGNVPLRGEMSKPVFIRWPNINPVTALSLLEEYLNSAPSDSLFRGRYPWPIRIKTAHSDKVLFDPGSAEARSPDQNAPPPAAQTAPAAPAAPTLPAQPNTAQAQPNAAPPQAPPPLEPAQAAVPKTTFVINFRRGDLWKEINLETPGLVETYDYCDAPKKQGAGYALNCTQGRDGKVRIRIRGFKDVVIDKNEPALEEKLEISGFRTAYPPSWGLDSGQFVEVLPGRLLETVGRALPVDQGIQGASGCRGTTQPISVANLFEQKVSFERPPCQSYVVAFEPTPALTTASSQVMQGCLPGGQMPVPIRGNRVTCWHDWKQTGPASLTLELFPGFDPVVQAVSREDIARGGITLTFAALARALVPTWPYPGRAAPSDEFSSNRQSPRYLPDTVEYVIDANRRCGPVPVAASGPAPSKLPSLESAGCPAVPVRARITFKVSPAPAASPDDPPAEAFVRSYENEVTIGNSARVQPLALESLKRRLPVGFNSTVVEEYRRQFRLAARSSDWPSLFVFTGDCNRPSEGRAVTYGAPKFGDPKAEFTWPLNGAVFDGKSDNAVTACAPARIETEGDKSYFTFRLEGTRAIGPRRVVVIANSQAFAKQSGTLPALKAALLKLIDEAYEAHQHGAPLSPITVYSVDSESNYTPIFSGEDAALKPGPTKSKIGERLDNAAVSTPNIGMLSMQPETKDGNLERVIFVMEGSQATQSNQGQLALLANKINNRSNLAFYVTSSGACDEWHHASPNFECVTLDASNVAARGKTLADAFTALLEPERAGQQESSRGAGGPRQ